MGLFVFFFFSSRRRHTRLTCDWSSDVCSSDLHSRRRREVAARQDRRADARERFFRGSAHQGGIAERKAMIDRDHELPITKQAEVLRISRGSVYYLPRPMSAADL